MTPAARRTSISPHHKHIIPHKESVTFNALAAPSGIALATAATFPVPTAKISAIKQKAPKIFPNKAKSTSRLSFNVDEKIEQSKKIPFWAIDMKKNIVYNIKATRNNES